MRHLRALIVVASLAFSLAGCGRGILPTTLTPDSQTFALGGRVHGGQQPVTGSTIQLYAVGTTGYGSTPTALGTASTTDSNGDFTLAGHGITCPTAATQVYLSATGGNPGLVGPVNNSAIHLMTAIGRCDSITTSSFYFIDEVSTIAAVYELAQFMDPATGNVGSYSSSKTGIVNAFSLNPSLINVSNGTANAINATSNGVVPQAEINTLANIIAPCVNSTDPSSDPCNSLFTAATPSGGTRPTDTLIAALSIALHPGSNVSTLMNLSYATAPFQPSLTTTPNDFTLAITYTFSTYNPTSITSDTSGNIWIADYRYPASSVPSCIVKTNPVGNPASPFCNGTNGVSALAIDISGTIWGASSYTGTVTGFDQSGNTLHGPITVGSNPQSIAVDGNSNLWVANTNDSSLSFIANSGNYNVSTFTGGGLSSPDSVAVDAQGNVWAANYGSNSISEFSSSGFPYASTAFSGGGLSQPQGIVIDASSNVWAGNFSGGVISEINSSGAPVSSSGYSGGSIGNASTIVFDGSGNLWSATLANTIAELGPTGTALTPSTGYTSSALNTPTGMAIDRSGNLWVINKTNPANSTTVKSKTVEFIGLAAPVVTPLSITLASGQFDKRPGTPDPVTVLTKVLPYYQTMIPVYSAELHASGGNSGAYTWSLASGSLPFGLSLSSAGVISGASTSPLGGTFTVQATDTSLSTNFGTQTYTLLPSSSLPTNANTANLNGIYAIQLSGFNGGTSATGGAVTGYAAIGQIYFQGDGTFNAQLEYTSSNSSTTQYISTFGNYTLGADNRGTLVVIPNFNLPYQLAFSVGDFSGSTPKTLRFSASDYTGSGTTTGMASGVAKLQDSSAFNASTIAQTFVFGLSGESPCSTTCGTVNTYGPLSAAGRIVNSGGTSTGQMDAAAENASYSVTLSGTYTAPDSMDGIGTMSLAPTGTLFSAPPTDYYYVVVNSGEIFLLSADGHTTSSLLFGDAKVQSGTFTNATVTGTYIGAELTTDTSTTSTSFPTQSNATIAVLSSTGTGTVNILTDESDAGQIYTEKAVASGLPYAVDSVGRMTLMGGTAGLPVFYLANGNTGYGTEQPGGGSGNTAPGSLILDKQTASAFSCSSLSGAYFFGNVAPPTTLNASTGILNVSSGAYTGTVDSSDPSGVLTQGQSTSFTCSTDSYTSTLGRLQLIQSGGKPYVAYILSPTKAVIISTKLADIHPSLLFLQQ